MKQEGDQVAIVFDGAGTRWIPELDAPHHRYHELLESVRDRIAGACAYCSKAYGVLEGVESSGVKLLDDFDQHPSLRSYLADGFQVVAF